MNWNAIDWAALERMRAAFLEGTAGAGDYWQSESDLASYDATFAQRIGWKWDYVLAELTRRGWAPPRGELLDWGCGSGIAHRAFLDHFGAEPVTQLRLVDRSELAVHYASRRAKERFPNLDVACGQPGSPALLLLSHVLTELNPHAFETLIALAHRASAVIWVEPGTHDASRALIAVREKLRGDFHVIAPCTHQAACGMLVSGNERHWCHHFAALPAGVFTDSNWGRFAHLAGIDLRSLPVSFLVLARRPPPSLPAGAVRVIGRPRVYKAHALLLGCDESGVRERRLDKRQLPEVFRRAKKDELDPLQVWRCDGDVIAETRAL
ncbi:MAG TPA: small ribosomal subunit Rsm22 family protein [Verrucomicrobiae bacterium]